MAIPPKAFILSVFFVCVATDAARAALIVNGDFSLGDTGFVSEYTSLGSVTGASTYAIANNPISVHPGGASFGDHTTGAGLMMVVNGATIADTTVWQQDLAVIAGGEYAFSGWVASWGKFAGQTVDPSPPTLRVYIDGASAGSDFAALSANGQWVQFGFSWHAVASSMTRIRIVDVNTAAVGNDFALDDLAVAAAVPEPSSAAILSLAALVGLGLKKRRSGLAR